MTPEERHYRGERAKALRNDPVLQSAFADLGAALIAEWRTTGDGDWKRREEIWARLKALDDVKARLGGYIADAGLYDGQARPPVA